MEVTATRVLYMCRILKWGGGGGSEAVTHGSGGMNPPTPLANFRFLHSLGLFVCF